MDNDDRNYAKKLESSIVNDLHTLVVAKVTRVREFTVDAEAVTFRIKDGNAVEYPPFEDLIPKWNSGSGSSETYPIAIGDYCEVFISENCLDYWYNGTDYIKPLENRQHDLSDGIAHIGLQNKSQALPIPLQITQTGDKIEIGNYTHQGNYDSTGNTTLAGDSLQTGTNTTNGDIILNGVSIKSFIESHTHISGAPGAPTGPPII